MEFPRKRTDHCPLCSYKSTWKSRLESHIRQHTQGKLFSCNKCGRGYSAKTCLRRHERTVHEEQPIERKRNFKCSLCPYATSSKLSLENHIGTHTGERHFPCDYPNCEHRAKSSKQLHVHKIRRHTSERKIECGFPSCQYRAKSTTDMKAHSTTHSECRPFVCDFEGCNYQAKRKQTLRVHKLVVHTGDKSFACSMCNYRAALKPALRKHELTHTEEKPIQCNFSGCAFSCKLKRNLSQHVLHCHTEKTFKCDFVGCSSSAASRLALETHKKNAHGEKVLKCPCCNFRATFPSNLRKHVEQRHTSSRRIQCPNDGCTFQTRHQESLRRHMKCHKANLGCPMQGCAFAGSSSSILKNHMQIHDPSGRPFPCPLCSKHFFDNATLSGHLQVHTKEKPFKCPVPACNYGASKKSIIRAHVLRDIHSAAFPQIKVDEESICHHCGVKFGCSVGLAMHNIKLKTAVVQLTRLQLKFD